MKEESLQENCGSGDVEWKPKESKKFAPGHTAALHRAEGRLGLNLCPFAVAG